MATGAELKRLSRSRLRSVRILMDASDWEAAAYMMGYVLETLLKAASCKSLKLDQYPDDKSKHQKQVLSFFMTHVFDQLLIISGLSDLFTPTAATSIYFNWSQFTSVYQGDWIKMRYDPQAVQQFTQTKVEELYGYLYENPDSILKVVARKRRC